jgi:hypothetical protein
MNCDTNPIVLRTISVNANGKSWCADLRETVVYTARYIINNPVSRGGDGRTACARDRRQQRPVRGTRRLVRQCAVMRAGNIFYYRKQNTDVIGALYHVKLVLTYEHVNVFRKNQEGARARAHRDTRTFPVSSYVTNTDITQSSLY